METYEDGEDALKKRVTVADSTTGPCHSAAVESKVFQGLHPIVAHLAVNRYDDGQPRQPGTLLVRVVGSNWQLTAKEPDVAAQLIVSAPSLDDALAALALALESDQTPWQPDPWARGQQGKGRKKSS